MGSGLRVEDVEGPALRAGLRAGDRIVTLAGHTAEDVLDLELAAADERFAVGLQRDGRPLTVEVETGRGEWHGITLWNGLGVPTRRCACACEFCFVDQVPPGLRAGLAFKDDDYRLSFLDGTFITLANLDERDLERIVRLRLSPLYVSLHAWDDDVRVSLMGPRARASRERLARLADAGIELHLQVVVCPGVNDGEVLRETLTACARLDSVADVGVVPVSLREERRLRRVRRSDAEAVLALVAEVQAACRASLGREFAAAADEFYLLCDRLPPSGDAPLQYENGIGICAAVIHEAAAMASPPTVDVALLGGTLAERPLAAVADRMTALASVAADRVRVRPYLVENSVFGPHVTVTGLLGGRDVLRHLGEEPLDEGEWLLAPRTFLPRRLGVTIDDVEAATIAAACGGRFVVADSLTEAVIAASGARRVES